MQPIAPVAAAPIPSPSQPAPVPAKTPPPAPLTLDQSAAPLEPAPKDPMFSKLKSSQPGTPTSLRHSTTAGSDEMRLRPSNGHRRTASSSSLRPSEVSTPPRTPSLSGREDAEGKTLPPAPTANDPQPLTPSAEEKAAKEAQKRELWLKAAPVALAVPVLSLLGVPLCISLTLVAPLPLLFATYKDHPATREEWFIVWGVVTAGVLYSAGVHVLLATLVLLPPLLFLVFDPRQPGGKSTDDDPYPPHAAQNDSVAWVNHALTSLFPVISSDVLTPFIDLLEDALMEQVPPVVTSVRVSGASLGNQPLLLTSMRHITDDDWFKASTESPEKVKVNGRAKSDTVSSGLPVVTPLVNGPIPSTPTQATPTTAATPATPVTPVTPAPATLATPSSTRAGRSSSNASRTSSTAASVSDQAAVDPFDPIGVSAVADSEQLRKRDRLLQRIRGQRVERTSGDQSGDQTKDKSNPVDDDEEGEFVNFEVGFQYRHSADAAARGLGLHMLAYFGWGIKGVGGSEIPVYIDVVEIKGKLLIRLLLTASPPFVRMATVTFLSMPEFNISARPLRSMGFGSINAMDLPLIKQYIQKSIAQVAGHFVRPKQYTMDVDRLLLGKDSNLRTSAIGILHVVIHGATDLPKADTVGSCDPYLAISYSKFNKPVYSTRTIVDNQNPIYDEHAFVLVNEDTIVTGEKLRLRMFDADRFSADDALGQVEVDVEELVDMSTKGPRSDELFTRDDKLMPTQIGMKTQGELHWSVRFFPLWKMPADQVDKRMERAKKHNADEGIEAPWWIKWIEELVEKPEWEKQREKERKDTLAMFCTERQREEVEAMARPTAERSSGVLQFHIHQCVDLELESLSGSYSADVSKRKSAAMGKPALADVVDRAPSEITNPPSAYVEVHLNDKLVYRTRTKQLNPMPYFNAVSERFIRDWQLAKITFVVKDARDREHDPILGVVNLRLRDVFKKRAQETHWYPLVGGLGWGKLRLSLLFKPLDMQLPKGISMYEVATFEVTALSTTDFSNAFGKPPSLVIETEYDKAILDAPGAGGRDSLDDEPRKADLGQPAPPVADDAASTKSGVSSARVSAVPTTTRVTWDIAKPVRLAIMYRTTSSILFSFVTRHRMKKTKHHAIATLRLDDVIDGNEESRVVPVFATSSPREAIRAALVFNQYQRQGDPTALYKTSSDIRMIGFIHISFVLHPGISRAHEKIAKRDMKFRASYKAWGATRMLDATPAQIAAAAANADKEKDDGYDSDTEDEEEFDSDDEARPGQQRADRLHEDDTRAMLEESNAHGKALRQGNRGLFQLKIARTGKLVKDKIEAKLLSSAEKTKQDRRPRGMDLEVEKEGQSRF
ncbi:hypothetical protein Q8F55_003963 [Vanrija albida]|uniref:C2 domain-containing protein n=1 Tax=Vanrija albida TaxID=181172 RepID=A0ABR3Q5F4_9TREE